MKFRKSMIALLVLCVLAVGLVACGPTSPSTPPPTQYYEIVFYEEDGFTELHRMRVASGEEIVYDGYDPRTPSAVDYEYAFAGWSQTVGGEVVSSMIATKNTTYYAVFTKTPAPKLSVQKPVADETVFRWTGEEQTYTLATDPAYRIYGNKQTEAGTHTVYVDLKDKTTHCWQDGTTDPLEFPFVIARAQNEWTTQPAINGWEVGQTPEAVQGAARYGAVTVEYGTEEDGTFTATRPTAAGSYFVRVSVAETTNYTGLTQTLGFVIDKNTFTVTLKRADGTPIDTVEVVKHAEVTYDTASLNSQTVDKEYVFVGWSLTANGAVLGSAIADGDKTLFAVIEERVRKYTVIFRDTDGTVLDTQEVAYGDTPEYKGAAITPEAGQMITAVFAGWVRQEADAGNDGLAPVTGEQTYVAAYETTFSTLYGDSESNPYVLTTAQEYKFFADALESGNDFENKYFRLGADLTVTTVIRAPKAFRGTLDGAGRTVTLTSPQDHGGDFAMFSLLEGTVRNVRVNAAVTGINVGAIASENAGVIEDCFVTGTLIGSHYVGGVCGLNKGTLTNNTVTADVRLTVDASTTFPSNLCGGTTAPCAGLLCGADEGTVTLARSVWDGSVASAFAGGLGTATEPYRIATAEQLAYLKDGAASNSYWSGVYFELTNPIDLNSRSWSGIGTGQGTTGFAGTLDGKGYAIYNVNVAAGTGSRKGFFNSLSTGALVRNVTVHGTLSGTGTGTVYLGLLAGISKAASYENVTVIGTVDTKGSHVALGVAWNEDGPMTGVRTYGSVSALKTVAGVVAYNKAGTSIGDLVRCVNYASVVSGEFAIANENGVGGICAVMGSGGAITECVNYGTVTAAEGAVGGAGGIIGTIFTSAVNDSDNYGAVTAGKVVGGIVGYLRPGGGIKGCENDGAVEATVYQAGGIAGYVGSTSDKTKTNLVENCVNRGAVKAGTHTAAGIVGHMVYGEVKGCDNEGAVTGTQYWIGGIVGMNGSSSPISGCTNSGAITGGDGVSTDEDADIEYAGVGGIVGSNYASAVTDCDNTGTVTGPRYVGGIVGFATSATGSVSSCDNTATVTATQEQGPVALGGIVGYNLGGVTGCTNSGTQTVASPTDCSMYGGIIGYDAAADGLVNGNTDMTA